MNEPESAPAPGSSAAILRGVVMLAVAAVTAASFLPVLRNQFLNWDDYQGLTANDHFRGLGLARLRWMFTTFHMGHYQPLSWLTLAIDYSLWGLDPRGYHLTNLVLHVTNAVLFCAVIGSLWRRASPPTSALIGFAALFFSVHPLRVESVAWITERRDVLCGTLVLLALIAYLEAQAPDRTAAVARRWHFASVLLFALSLLAKASGVALPLVLLLLDRYPMRRPWSRRLVWEKLPFFALSLAASLVAVFAQRDAGAMLTLEHGPPLQRVAQACYGLGFYLWKTVLPLHLSPLYEWDARMDVLAMKYVAPVACAIALTALAFARRRRWPALWTCWCCYVVMVLPVLGLFQSGPQLAADRYTYLPCLPWAILAAWGLGRLPGSRAARAAIGVAVIAALATLTWRYTLVFRDSTSLWNRVLRESPDSYIGHFNLGNALDADGHRELAVPHYEAAIALRPNEMKARHSLASDLLAQNDYRKAIELWQQTLAIEQTHPEVFQGLGSAYAALGDAPEAVRAFERALALDPTSPNALNGLGQLCWQSGDQKKAMEYWRKTIALHPDSVVAHNYLGVALLQRGQLKDAEAEFRTVLAQHAEDPDALTNLGALLLGQGKKDEAVACWKRALAADPTHPGARQNLERFGSR